MNVVSLLAVLLMAANQPESIQEGLSWSPNALCLDLQGLVHPDKRHQAREGAREAIKSLGASKTIALVRINPETAEVDLKAVMCPGLKGVVVPEVDGPEMVQRLDKYIGVLERGLKMPRGSVGLIPFLDNGRGLWRAKEVVRSSSRIMGIVLAMGDLLFDMLKTPEPMPFFTGPVPRFPVPEYLWSRLALIAAIGKVPLLGLLGTTVVPGVADEQALREAANRARQAGFRGAFVRDKKGVATCQKGFVVPAEAQRMAREILAWWRQGHPIPKGQVQLALNLLGGINQTLPRE